ncbi:hypothetical protein, partial [Nocardia sp. CY41]|uniref:hypothetical protein n=1 Tax=Nocardia sp. CY41 TaxID=2608686 RepID=UPI001F1E6BE9
LLLIHRIHHGFECLRHQMILPAEPSGSASQTEIRYTGDQTLPELQLYQIRQQARQLAGR